jgi:prephenate dehydratase
LENLAPDIQTQKNNITRFLVLQRTKEAKPIVGANKASIYFQTNHSKGILAKVLTEVAKTGVNLSKLQSMPIPGSHFKYGFYADMEFDQLKQFENMMRKIESLTNNVKLFGIYKKGKLVKG